MIVPILLAIIFLLAAILSGMAVVWADYHGESLAFVASYFGCLSFCLCEVGCLTYIVALML